jgi:hypothetical protein
VRIGISHGPGNLLDAEPIILQQAARCVDSQTGEIAEDRHAGCLAEEPADVPLAEVDLRSDVADLGALRVIVLKVTDDDLCDLRRARRWR